MIKMVCSDLDGTLLQYGKKLIEGEIFDEIRALHDHGILFCPASGRQYTSLRKLFAPVADDCIYLCENGAVVYRGGKVIAKTPMPRALAEEIAWDFWNNTENLGEVMLSGENMSYLMERGHGVVDRINRTAGNELMNIITIFLGFSVGCTTNAATFLNIQTVEIIVLGIVAFGVGTAGGVLLGKVMCFVTHGKINPLIGSAGVSAVPMAARVSQKVGQEYNPRNYLLMHAMGPNVAGVIGSAVAAGILINMFG